MKEKVTIFVCAHKEFDVTPVKDSHYTIIAQRPNLKFDKKEVIDISREPFTKRNQVGYGEGCMIYWLWKHPEVLGDIVVTNHYRRIFTDYGGREDDLAEAVRKHGCVVSRPFNHPQQDPHRYCNWDIMKQDHVEQEAVKFINCAFEAGSDYANGLCDMLAGREQYPCNVFAMRKEDFMEYCEFVFRVLSYYDMQRGFKKDTDRAKLFEKYQKEGKLKAGTSVSWNMRIDGFWMEWLTEAYIRQKFDIDKVEKSLMGMWLKYLSREDTAQLLSRRS